jgi:hypothetical protein
MQLPEGVGTPSRPAQQRGVGGVRPVSVSVAVPNTCKEVFDFLHVLANHERFTNPTCWPTGPIPALPAASALEPERARAFAGTAHSRDRAAQQPASVGAARRAAPHTRLVLAGRAPEERVHEWKGSCEHGAVDHDESPTLVLPHDGRICRRSSYGGTPS